MLINSSCITNKIRYKHQHRKASYKSMHEQVWKYGIFFFFNQTVKTNIREKKLWTAIEIFAIYNQVFEGRILLWYRTSHRTWNPFLSFFKDHQTWDLRNKLAQSEVFSYNVGIWLRIWTTKGYNVLIDYQSI